MFKGYKKVNYFDLQKEEITMKEYIKTMDLNGARTMFAHNSQTMKHIKLNQMNHEPYSKVNWRCHECSSISSSRHIKWCPAYSHLREDLSLERDDHLIKYLQEVIKIREDADNKEWDSLASFLVSVDQCPPFKGDAKQFLLGCPRYWLWVCILKYIYIEFSTSNRCILMLNILELAQTLSK